MPDQSVILNPNNYVILCAWPPSNHGKPVSYLEALFMRNCMPQNIKKDSYIGHAAMYICHGDVKQYVSFYPTKSNPVKSTFAINHSYKSDVRDQGNLHPQQIVLFNLDTKTMLEELERMKGAEWFLSGVKIINPEHKKIYNCSSFVEHLLRSGGLYQRLLSEKDALPKIMSPMDVYNTVLRASEVECKKFPETKELLQQYSEIFKIEIISQSEDKTNPYDSVNDFLLRNPDFYMRINQLDPNELSNILNVVSQNIQNHHNRQLLQLVENHQPGELFPIEDLERLLNREANLSLHNKDGFNALHLMVKKQCFEGIRLLLNKAPQVVNLETKNPENDSAFQPKTALDLANDMNDESIITLLKKNSGMTKQCKDTLKTSANNLDRLFKYNDDLNKAPSLDQSDETFHVDIFAASLKKAL